MMKLIILPLVMLCGASSIFARGDICESCRIQDSSFSQIHELSQNAKSIGEEAYSPCNPQLNAKDEALLQSIRNDLSGLEPAWEGKAGENYKKSVDSIILKYEKQLSPAAVRAVIADSNKRLLEQILITLSNSPSLSRHYLRFVDTVAWHKSQRAKFMHGFWDNLRGRDRLAEEDKKLDQAYQELLGQLINTPMEPNTRRVMTVAVHRTAGEAYANASEKAVINANRASVGMAAAGAVLTVDLAVAAWITGGIAATGAASAASGTATAIGNVLWSTASSAASGAAAGGGLAGTKILGSALLKTKRKEKNDFFCRLAQEVEEKGPTYIHDSLVGAVFGSVFGGASGIASKTLLKAKTALGVSMTGLGALGATKDGAQVLELDRKAHEAKRAGDEKAAARYIERRNERALSLGLDVASIAAGGVTIAAGKRLKPKSATRSPKEILAYLKTKKIQPAERQELAQEVLGGKPLPEKTRAAIEKAHSIAPDKIYGTHSPSELRYKIDVLMKEGDLSKEQASKLLRAGICGSPEGPVPEFILHGEQTALHDIQVRLNNKSRYGLPAVQKRLSSSSPELAKAEAVMRGNNVDHRSVGNAIETITQQYAHKAEVSFAQHRRVEGAVSELRNMEPHLARLGDDTLMKAHLNHAQGDGTNPFTAFYDTLKNASYSGMERESLDKVLQAGLNFRGFKGERLRILEAMENLLKKENAILAKSGDALDAYRSARNAELRLNLFKRRSMDIAAEQSGRPVKDWEDAYDILADDDAWRAVLRSY